MGLAGNAPIDCGHVDLEPSEMMFCMYMPISVPDMGGFFLPDNLKYIAPLLVEVRNCEPDRFVDQYVYLTAKTLYVDGFHIGNRPGWHIDGYGTDDLNFIWADRAPTKFLVQQNQWQLSDDCDESLHQMGKIGRYAEAYDHVGLRTYPDKHLLRLNNRVMHRSPTKFEPGVRTFIKVSLSDDRYNLKGNAVNPRLPGTHWPLLDRAPTRNHPSKDHT